LHGETSTERKASTEMRAHREKAQRLESSDKQKSKGRNVHEENIRRA
jgi:hypothetical protein